MSNKIPANTIELTRLEGRIEECGKVYSFNSFPEANKQLRHWSLSAPKTGGYDKCRFNVIFEDGQEYEGRYDLKHISCEQDEGPTINLRERIASHCRFMAGRERPSWMNDTQWEQSRASNKSFENDYKEFLGKYDI